MYRDQELYRDGKIGIDLYFAYRSFAGAYSIFWHISKGVGFASSGFHVFWADGANRCRNGFRALRKVFT